MSEVDPAGVASIGRRLKDAREARGLSLEEVATQTRIPIRHLGHIEDGEWEALPATTYSVGFARAYANAVGLNGNEVGAELRQQLGATRATYDAPAALYEPADPARVPPRSLVTIVVVVLALLVGGYLIWRNMAVNDDIDPLDTPVAEAPAQTAAQPAQPQGAPAPAATTGPVVLTATDEVWLRVYEASGGASLFQGVLQAGQKFEVPATAQAPQIRTGRPQAITVSVGSTRIPPLGNPEQTINNVSLLPADLIARTGGAQGGTGQPTLPQPSQPVPGPAAAPGN